MKNYIYVVGLVLTVFWGCGQKNSVTSDSESCSSSCEAKSDGAQSGYDANMSQMCQQACGVNDYDESQIVDPLTASSGDITKCPVSGAIYIVKDDSPTLSHDGKNFHSCCTTCADIFKTNPERFVKNL